MANSDNLITDLKHDVIIDTSREFYADERKYDVETSSFSTIDPLDQMCEEPDEDGYTHMDSDSPNE